MAGRIDDTHYHTIDSILATGDAHEGINLSDPFVQHIVQEIVQVQENNTYIEQITQNETYVQNFLTELTELTEITEENTYITNLVTQIVAQINGKKGIASELATLDADSQLTHSQIPDELKLVGIPFVIDGGGSAITTGLKGGVEIPFACTITGWTILAADGNSGAIVVDVWKDTYAAFPPVVGDSIAGSEKPTITATGNKGQDLSLNSGNGWSVSAGDILFFNVDSVATLTRVSITFRAVRTI